MFVFKEIALGFLLQLAFTVGVVVLFGYLVAACRRGFGALLGNAGYKTLLITGIVGTPIHELSHALMCLLFGHKITEIKLYDPNSGDGSIGHVSHSYNPKNLYHQVGNFFIGIAPILGGGAMLLLLMWLLVPDIFWNVGYVLTTLRQMEGFAELCGAVGRVIVYIFDFSNAANWRWWLFIILSLMISSHMELSGADIKGGVKGFLMLCGLLFAVDLVVGLISLSAMHVITSAMLAAGITLASFLTVAGIFSVLLLLIAAVIKLIPSLFGRR